MAILRPLPELWHLFARRHGLLKGFAGENQAAWTPDVRRIAGQVLACLAAMLRRLIHLEAQAIVLAPLAPRDPEAALPPLRPPPRRRPRLRFCLIESSKGPRHRGVRPIAGNDPPELTHAIFMDRLEILAEAYRARHRLARRLARRVQAGRAPLRTPPLAPRLRPRVPDFLCDELDILHKYVATRDSS